MQKVILGSVAMICVTIFGCIYVYIRKPIYQNNNIVEKYSYCLKIAMSESRQSGKIIDIEKAKEICEKVN